MEYSVPESATPPEYLQGENREELLTWLYRPLDTQDMYWMTQLGYDWPVEDAQAQEKQTIMFHPKQSRAQYYTHDTKNPKYSAVFLQALEGWVHAPQKSRVYMK